MTLLDQAIDGYLQWMAENGYTEKTVKEYTHELNRFRLFVVNRKRTLGTIFTHAVLRGFKREYPTSRRHAIRGLSCYLYEQGKLSGHLRMKEPIHLPQVYEDYLIYQQKNHQATPRKAMHIRTVLVALHTFLKTHRIGLRTLTIEKIDGFLSEYLENYKARTCAIYRSRLRGFLRYLFYERKLLSRDLAPLIVGAPQFAKTKPPHFLRPDELQRLFAGLRFSSPSDLRTLAKMIRLMHPSRRALGDRILKIPQKRFQKQLIGFLYPNEVLKVYEAVDLRTGQGFRDYTILNLLYDSGARASEIASMRIDFFDPEYNTLAILGKGDRYRQIELMPKTARLIHVYLEKYRKVPNPIYQSFLFINQRRTGFTRHGINRICKKYLRLAFNPKRLVDINPAHSFSHSCAVRMLLDGKPVNEIKIRLGHENIQSTMTYLHMDLTRKRDIQNKFIEYSKKTIQQDPKIEALIDWENKQDILAWLDSL